MGPDPSALDTLKLLRSWTAAKRYPVLDEKKREVLFDDIVLKVIVRQSLGIDAVGSGVLVMACWLDRKMCVWWNMTCFDDL